MGDAAAIAGARQRPHTPPMPPRPLPLLDLPTTIEGVTAAWLTTAFRATGANTRVTAAEIVDVIYGTSTKIRVALNCDEGDYPKTVIVKGGFESHSPLMGPMYRNEADFYHFVQPHITITSPRCYFAGSDPNSHQSIVVMEDLGAANVTWLHAQRPQSYDAIARRLRAIAKFHAETWESAAFEPGGPLDWVRSRFEGASMDYANRYLEPEVWSHYVTSPRGAAVSTRLHDLAWMRRAFTKFAAIEQAGPRCLIHGDTHLGNLYVTADGEPGFLDAQVSRTHWSFEIAYHIVCACDLSDRPHWEHDLLDVYLDALRAHGIAAPGHSEAFDRYAEALAYGLFIFLINETRFQTEAINTAYAARFGAAALAHDTIERLS